MINVIDIWWHCVKEVSRFRPHQMCWMLIEEEKHWHCSCGYKKPQRVYVSIRE